MHICISKLTIIGTDNGLSSGRRHAIILTNAGILLIEPFGTKLSEIVIEIHIFSFKKMYLKMLSGKWRPFCISLNMLRWIIPSSYFLFLSSFQYGIIAGFPQIGFEKFQWFFNDISRQKSQISTIILKCYKTEKHRTTCYTWSPHTSYDHLLGVFKKICSLSTWFDE